MIYQLYLEMLLLVVDVIPRIFLVMKVEPDVLSQKLWKQVIMVLFVAHLMVSLLD